MDRPLNESSPGRVFVVGASNMDICAKSLKPVLDADSNIGSVSTSCGGVGRNIAVALKYLGFDVSFLTAVADDAFGRTILESLADSSIEAVAAPYRGEGLSTGVYSYILDSNGTLLCGINDMGINDALTPAAIDERKDVINGADYVVFEANLPHETIVRLGQLADDGARLVADCVSATKCVKLLDVLGDLFLLKANYSEACTLAGMDDSAPKDPLAVAQRLAGKGLERGIITLGGDGAFCFEVHAFEEGGLEWCRVEPPKGAEVVNTNGCGDVLLAGFLCALSKGCGLKDALWFGQKAASVNARSVEAVSEELLSLA